MSHVLYNITLYLVALPLLYIGAFFHRRLRENVRGRRGLIVRAQSYRKRLEREAEETGKSKKVVLFHISSAGEFEQARPLISALKEKDPGISIAISFFSVSGIKFIAKKQYNDADFVDFSPFDFRIQVQRYLDIVKPCAIVFVRYELWPNFIHAANARRIRLSLIDVSVHTKSWSHRPGVRMFYRRLFNKFETIMTISPLERDRVRQLFNLSKSVKVVATGDTKYDRVLANKRDHPKRIHERHCFDHEAPYIVGGSTWAKDEEYLLYAYVRLIELVPNLQMILAPHDIDRVSELRQRANEIGVPVCLLTQFGAQEKVCFEGVIIVDSLGILADLYQIADISYIGGALTSRIHNVAEAAIMHSAVLFGPYYTNSSEAIQLLAARGAEVFYTQSELVEKCRYWLQNPQVRAGIADNAQRFIENNGGAAKRCLSYIRL